jgi:serine/threonine protein kinase
LIYNKQFLEYNDINLVENSMLRRMLDLNPNNRPTIDEVISSLELKTNVELVDSERAVTTSKSYEIIKFIVFLMWIVFMITVFKLSQ